MVAEWISEELRKTKTALEAQMQAQIAAQKAKAEADYVVPKEKALDEERKNILLTEKELYDKQISELTSNYNTKVTEINKTYEATKAAYKEKIYSTVQSEIEKSFQATIDMLNTQIGE